MYLGFSWLPAVLTGVGFTSAVASNGITAFNLGGVVGAIGGGLAFARVGSRVAMLVMAAGAIAGAVALSQMTIEASMARLPLFALLTLTGGLINAVQTTMYALATNLYGSAIRATGTGVAVSVGRLGPSSAAMQARGHRLSGSARSSSDGRECDCFVMLRSCEPVPESSDPMERSPHRDKYDGSVQDGRPLARGDARSEAGAPCTSDRRCTYVLINLSIRR